jgi:hypothetical protein
MKQHKQRAASAFTIASAMAAYRCALHHGEVTHPTLHLDGVEVQDVIDALSRMLQLQTGPVTVVVTPTAEDAWQLAEQVAANSGYDTAMFKSATRLGDRRTKYWAASQVFKPEDNPDWN